ncbi:hypothetical protein [Gordonia sp. NB41Y]|uniref:hypothetical protein n=1 Tax=Gordonia sp. NB41Y TaxID=875808 RepID=UPI00034B2E10|nr:hypothetical protein [Gordonia sp. NB41Y]EMP13836.2 hypothetical protein ISGA_4221 [Gordonia sp. NB41Y]WLP92402.1 hypothetical protein Q9K23_09325 [Gordonia sp. NB41Y]
MNIRIRRAVTAIGISVIAVGGAGVAVAPASAEKPAMLDISGDLAIAPGVHLLHIEAHGDRTKSGETSGTYVATVMDGRNRLPVQVKGPVTCIYTKGDTGSLIYPIDATSPDLVPAGLKGAYAVQITVRKGAPDMVGVVGPMATSSFHGCEPGTTPFTFDGKIGLD